MAVISELIRPEADGSLSFGNYELAQKTKKPDFEHEGDLYKVKTFAEITRLERNELFVFESVPGTAVTGFAYTENGMRFRVEGPKRSQITVEADPEQDYRIYINGELCDTLRTNLGGKLSFSVGLDEMEQADVLIERA